MLEKLYTPPPKDDVKLSGTDFCLTLTRAKVSNVVLSIPHDGAGRYEFDGIFSPREKGVTVRDMNIWPIGREIFAQTSTVSLVRGMLPRTLVDYNRALDDPGEPAVESKSIIPFYSAYHKNIEHLLHLAVQEYGQGLVLLLDLHGFSRQPIYAPEGGYDCILGTGNRRSILHDNIDQELAGFLEQNGYKVFLPEEKTIRDGLEDDFDAGHITCHHSKTSGVNAIQVEIASHLRGNENLEASKYLAKTLTTFINQRFGA